MGRGRQRAKHMRVARELKYQSPETDLKALERELASARSGSDVEETRRGEWEDDSGEDDYSSYSARWDDEDR